jgi:hypothetical protein
VKKIIAFILLLSLFFNLSGYYLFFYLRKQELKADMKEMLRSSKISKDIEQFIFPLNNENLVRNPQWEGDDEFRLNGDMYDVVEKRVEGNNIIVRCISDKKETQLLKDYEKTTKDDFSNSSSRHKSILLLKLAGSLYINQFVNETFYYKTPLIKHGPVCCRTIPTISPDILIPPPKVV